MDAVTVAQLSDTHFGQFPAAGSRTRTIVEHLNAFDPPVDLTLVTGDIADHGETAEYDEAAAVLGGLRGPVAMCPGNHDVRDGYARILRRREADGPVNEIHDVAGWRFVMLDSLIPAPPGDRIDPGELAPETLAFLDTALDGRPAVVCLHHPPVELGLGLMDPIMLREPERLEAVIRDNTGVVAVMVGHAHTAAATTFAGLPLLIPGGVVSTVTLDADPLPFITNHLDPTFAIHRLYPDGRVLSQWRTLPGGAVPESATVGAG